MRNSTKLDVFMITSKVSGIKWQPNVKIATWALHRNQPPNANKNKINVFILYGQCIILGSTILISTVNNSLYFLRKLIIIHRFLETDSTEIYTPRLSLGQNCQQPQINHRLHEIIMMVSYLNFHRRRFGCFFKLM